MEIPLKKDVLKAVEDKAPAYIKLADSIWDTPELCFKEFKSSAMQMALLGREGFLVTKGLAGMSTAFVAEAGKGGPIIGFLGEFDALSGLSQDAGVAVQQTSTPGANGHGCGHNLHGAGAMLAAVALRDVLKAHGVEATVRYYGCPAEEGGSGKTFMTRAGVFDDLDVALNWHPSSFSTVKAFPSLAVIQAAFRFTGKAAHAAAAPHMGRSALDAVELFNVGVNYLREHMPDQARIHYAVTDSGGTSPNVVQARAEVLYYVRAPDIHETKELFQRVKKVAEGAAWMTETTLEVSTSRGCSNNIYNKVLDDVMYDNLLQLGPPPFDDVDREFAAEIRKTFSEEDVSFNALNFGFPSQSSKVLSDDVVREAPQLLGGSSDMGDVTWVAPTTQYFGACYAIGTEFHTWQLVAQGKTLAAHKGMIHAAKVLAATAIDLIQNPDIIEKAKENLKLMKSNRPYSCPIPPEVQPPSYAEAC